MAVWLQLVLAGVRLEACATLDVLRLVSMEAAEAILAWQAVMGSQQAQVGSSSLLS